MPGAEDFAPGTDQTMRGTIVGIYRYPVKGLSPEPMSRADLVPGQTLAHDRCWAIENGPGRFNPDEPQHLPKINFLMLMRDERLATLQSTFDAASQTLTILRAGKQVARGQLVSKLGRQLIEQFLAAYMKDSLRGPPKLVSAPGHSFSDVAAKCLHIINLASLRELERAMKRPLDPLRFRPNVIVDGLEPWAEFQLIGQTVAAGATQLKVVKRTERCAATNVEPDTGVRDTAIPAALMRSWGHTDFGVYASVVTAGAIAIGEPFSGTSGQT